MSFTKPVLFCSFLVVDSYFWPVNGQRINLNCRFSIAQGGAGGRAGDCEDRGGLVGGYMYRCLGVI